ncbi:MAG: hypothetical protein ACYDH6_16720 [Acidimicrobiales bacterium]
MTLHRPALGALASLIALVSVTGTAWAVSGGNYSPSQQDCPANGLANNTKDGTVIRGCHNVGANVTDGKGKRYAEFGLDELPLGYPGTPGLLSLGYPGAPNSPHSGCVAVNTNGTNGGTGVGCGKGKGTGLLLTFDLQKPANNSLTPATGATDVGALIAAIGSGITFAFNADDNADAGEHDGVSGRHGTHGAINGPSDGGGTSAWVSPQAVSTTPSLTNPLPFLGAQLGFCADGFCVQATTRRQVLYQGCGANPSVPCKPGSKSRNAYDYRTKQWDPYNCSSGDAKGESPGPDGCGNKTMDQWRAAEGPQVYAEPGLQLYEDPDPQGSPAGPIYPIPSAYVGTCGVAFGGGPVTAPKSPVTNGAGQLIVSTGC